MTSTSTLVEAKNAIVELLATALATSGENGQAVPCYYSWRPDVREEQVFLGVPQYDAVDGFTRTITEYVSPVAELTSLSAAVYRIEGTCYSYRPDLTPVDAAIAEARVDVLWGACRTALNPLSWVGPLSVEFRLRAFQSGWHAEAAFVVTVHSFVS